MTHQHLEQGELAGREPDHPLTHPGPAGDQVELELADRELDRVVGGRPQAGPEPCRELVDRERLRDVVACPHVQASDSFLHVATRGQDHHRDPRPSLADGAQDVQPVDVGESEIQHDHAHVVGHRVRHLAAGRHATDLEAPGAQALLDERGDAVLVLDEQNRQRGIRIQNVAPLPGWFSTPASPPWPRAMLLTTASPSPEPRDAGPCTKRSNASSSCPLFNPSPWSSTANLQALRACPALRSTGVPSGVWTAAFCSRLTSACSSRSGSASTTASGSTGSTRSRPFRNGWTFLATRITRSSILTGCLRRKDGSSPRTAIVMSST